MQNLKVIGTRNVGTYTIKTYDLPAYRDLREDLQEKVWKALTTITMIECLPFGEAVLMEYLEFADKFEAAFTASNRLVAFQLISKPGHEFTDPDTEAPFKIFTCPYEHESFLEPVWRAQDLAAMRAAAPRGFTKLPAEVESEIGSYLSGVSKKATTKEQMEELRKQSGQSRVNRKTRRSKGKRRNTKRTQLRNLPSRRR